MLLINGVFFYHVTSRIANYYHPELIFWQKRKASSLIKLYRKKDKIIPVTHNQFKIDVLIIKNPVNWFAVHIKWLISI